jgi:hypothetical protein
MAPPVQERSAEAPDPRRPHRHGPSDPTIRSVVTTALGTYRRHVGSIVLAGVLIFVPVDLLLIPIRSLVERFAEARDAAGLLVLSASAAAGIVASLIGITIFAGVIGVLAAAGQEGTATPILVGLLRHPMVRLVLAGVLVGVLVLAGAIAFFVPGLVLLVLLSIVGPLIALERIGIGTALVRSARLVSRHLLLVVVTVTIPLMLEGQPARLLERYSGLEAPWATVSLDVLTSVFLGGLVGVLEVTLAHALLAEERRRRAAHDAGSGRSTADEARVVGRRPIHTDASQEEGEEG